MTKYPVANRILPLFSLMSKSSHLSKYWPVVHCWIRKFFNGNSYYVERKIQRKGRGYSVVLLKIRKVLEQSYGKYYKMLNTHAKKEHTCKICNCFWTDNKRQSSVCLNLEWKQHKGHNTFYHIIFTILL